MNGWWAAASTLKRFVWIAGAIGTIATAAIAVANAARLAEPYWIATRGFVVDEIADARFKVSSEVTRLEQRQIETQLSIAKSARRNIQNEIANKQLIIQQNPSMPATVRSLIDEQIRNLLDDLDSTKDTIEGLNKERK